MHTLKLVVKVFLMQIAILGIILSVLATWYAWSYNTPVTASLTRVVAGTERVLTAVDSGLRVVNSGLRTALGAVNTIDGATRSAGERIVDTNFAFLILERAVGDTLFPRIVAAQQCFQLVQRRQRLTGQFHLFARQFDGANLRQNRVEPGPCRLQASQQCRQVGIVAAQGIHPEKQGYHLHHVPGKTFSGNHLLAYYYVSWKLAIPEMVEQLHLPYEMEYGMAVQLSTAT